LIITIIFVAAYYIKFPVICLWCPFSV